MSKNLIRGEFIGELVTIKTHNKIFTGIIIDETKNMFTIKVSEKTKKIIKKNTIIMIKDQKIFGDEVIKRPEDRIKIKGFLQLVSLYDSLKLYGI